MWPFSKKRKPGRTVIPQSAPRGPARQLRRYQMAQLSDLLADWPTTGGGTDAENRAALPAIRARSRDLAQNEDYMRRFLTLVESNVVGPEGAKLRPRLLDGAGDLDLALNARIREAWEDWGDTYCEVSGLTWTALQEAVVRQCAEDGEVLIKLVRNAANPYRFQLQLLPVEALPVHYTLALANGAAIRGGVEYDSVGRRVAYHFQKVKQGYSSVQVQGDYERVPAEDVLHIKLERPALSRGMPWVHTAGRRMKMLGGYEYAEVTSARVAATKTGVWTPTDTDGVVVPPDPVPGPGDGMGRQTEGGEGYYSQTDPGALVDTLREGELPIAPLGYELKSFDPQHPNANYGAFVRSVVRGIAAGLGVSYEALSADLEGANYSSMRSGQLIERDVWRQLQAKLLVRQLCKPVLAAWTPYAIAGGQLALSMARADELRRRAKFSTRGWQWVDPQKEVTAATTAIDWGLNSRTQTLEQRGLDYVEVVEELAEEEAFAASKGVDVFGGNTHPPAPEPPEEDNQSGAAGGGRVVQLPRKD